jgi:tungstate transport system substrate-binding protein
MRDAPAALVKIAAKQTLFISRGDKSVTHVAEMGLWDKAGQKPARGWYVVYEKVAEGNSPALQYTDQKQAYTVIDRATFLGSQKEISVDCSRREE